MKLTELLREIYLSSKCNCGCNSCSTTPTLTESKTPISENLQYHINKGIMLSENEFRIGSKAYMQLFKEARSLYKEGKLEVGSLDKALLETDLGEFGDYSEEIEYGSIIQIDPNEFPSFEFPFGTQGEIIGIDNDYMTDNHTYTVKIKYIDGQGDIATELITDGVNGFIFETQKVPLDLPMLNEFNIRDEVKIGMKVLHDGDIFKIIGITPLSIELEEQAYSPMPNLIFPDDFGRDANIEDIWQYFEIYTDYDDTMVEAEYQGKDVPLGKPKRGGSKAYYVYVRDPKTKKVKKANKKLNEIGDASIKPYEWVVKKSSYPSWDLGMEKPFIEAEYKFTTDKGVKYKAGFSEEEEHGFFHFAFYPEGGGIRDIVNKGEVFRVMSTIVDIFKDFIEKEEWSEIYYSSVRQNYGDKRREKLYMAYLKNNLPGWIKIEDIGLGDIALKNQKQNINEAKKNNKKLNKPMRDSSGGKAYKVYVRDPKTKKIKTVRFGSGGLRAKINDKKARNAFAKRHNCDQKKDRTTAGYWSCNLPRYAKALGLGSNMNTFW